MSYEGLIFKRDRYSIQLNAKKKNPIKKREKTQTDISPKKTYRWQAGT